MSIQHGIKVPAHSEVKLGPEELLDREKQKQTLKFIRGNFLEIIVSIEQDINHLIEKFLSITDEKVKNNLVAIGVFSCGGQSPIANNQLPLLLDRTKVPGLLVAVLACHGAEIPCSILSLSAWSFLAFSSRRFLISPSVQAFLGWVPGRKYSSLAGQPAQASSPVMVQTWTCTKSGGGEKPGAGEELTSSFIIRRQIGEAPVTPEAT